MTVGVGVGVHNEERVLLEGPFHGRVVPSESMWALADHDPCSPIKGPRLVLSLEKGYAHREIWATVFDREFIKTHMKEDGDGEGERYSEKGFNIVED